MTSGPRRWLVGAAAVVGIAAVVAVTVSGGETNSGLPRVRISIPGADNEVDLFAQETGDVTGDDADLADVIPYDDIEQLRSTFNADLGHPRLILLVDPI